MKEGKYIVIEGHDGTGKSTQVEIARRKLLICGIESIEFHEPAGDPIADAIRDVIKNGNLERSAETNLLLFTASRRELWLKRAMPALKMGKWVVAARNYYSTLAYQGYGEGLDFDLIKETTRRFTDERYMNPDIPIILDPDDEEARQERISRRTLHRRAGDDRELDKPDTFESRDEIFQLKVREGYLSIAKDYDIPVISASRKIDEVAIDVWDKIKPYID